jgi:hypothetical protein
MSTPKKMPASPLTTVRPARKTMLERDSDSRPAPQNRSEVADAVARAQRAGAGKPAPEAEAAKTPEAEEQQEVITPEPLERSVLEDATKMSGLAEQIRWETEQSEKKFEAERRLVDRMEQIEQRVDPIDVESALLSGVARQKVPVSDRLTYEFRTIHARVEIIASRVAKAMYEELGGEDESGLGQAYILQMATVCCGLVSINGRIPGSRSVSELDEAGRDKDRLQEIITDLLEHRLDASPTVNQELYAHYAAFIARVRRAFADEGYVAQSVGNS